MEKPFKFCAWVLLLLLLAFAAYYPYRFFGWAIPFSFSGPAGWQDHWRVDETAMIPFGHRLSYFMLWLPSVIATEFMVLGSAWLSWMLIKGHRLSHQVVRLTKWIGGLAAFAALSLLAAYPFDAWWLTAYNTDGPAPIKPFFDSGEIGYGLAGFGIFLLARVLQLSVMMDTENQEII